MVKMRIIHKIKDLILNFEVLLFYCFMSICAWLQTPVDKNWSFVCGIHIHGFNQLWIKKYSGNKNSRKFQKAEFEFSACNYLHGIHNIFTTIYVVFTLCKEWEAI